MNSQSSRIVRIAVLGDPRGAGQQQVEAPHVQQRHAAHQRAEQLGILREHDAHQQAAVAAALRAELLDGGDPARHQILCDRGEVLGHQVPALPHRLGVPAGSVFAAAADVGQHVGAAAGQPQPAQHPVVAGGAGDLEAAVSAQQGRARALQVAVAHHEVRDRGAVVGRGEVLGDLEVGGVEERRCPLDLGQRAAGTPRAAAATACRNRWSPGRSRRRGRRRPRSTVLVFGGRPATGSRSRCPASHLDAAGHVGEGDQHQPVPRPGVVVQAGVPIGFEDHCSSAVPARNSS